MTFHRVKPFLASYLLNSSPLERLSTVNDLGVLFDPKLSFNVHISSIVNKATSTLGFVKRWAKEFNDPYLTKTLYTSLVRPILEYCSCVWSPAHKNHIMSIESVQKNFWYLHYAASIGMSAFICHLIGVGFYLSTCLPSKIEEYFSVYCLFTSWFWARLTPLTSYYGLTLLFLLGCRDITCLFTYLCAAKILQNLILCVSGVRTTMTCTHV